MTAPETLAERIDAARERANAAWEALCATTVPRLGWGPAEARGAYLKAAREVEGLIAERERDAVGEVADLWERLAEAQRTIRGYEAARVRRSEVD